MSAVDSSPRSASSRPKPSRAGIMTSETTRSGRRSRTRSRAATPSPATVEVVGRRQQRHQVLAHVGVVVDDEDVRRVGVRGRRAAGPRRPVPATTASPRRGTLPPAGPRRCAPWPPPARPDRAAGGRCRGGTRTRNVLPAPGMLVTERSRRAAPPARRRGRGRSRTPRGCANGPVDPVEPLEQPLLLGRVDPDAGVRHGEFRGPVVARDGDPDAAGERVLERVGQQVEDDLRPHLVVDVGDDAGLGVDHEVEPGGGERGAEHPGDLDGRGGEVERLVARGHPAGLEPGEVQEHVDQLEHPDSVAAHDLQPLALGRVERVRGIGEGVLGRAQQESERGTELVADVGEEARLRPVQLREGLCADPLRLVGACRRDPGAEVSRHETEEAGVPSSYGRYRLSPTTTNPAVASPPGLPERQDGGGPARAAATPRAAPRRSGLRGPRRHTRGPPPRSSAAMPARGRPRGSRTVRPAPRRRPPSGTRGARRRPRRRGRSA